MEYKKEDIVAFYGVFSGLCSFFKEVKSIKDDIIFFTDDTQGTLTDDCIIFDEYKGKKAIMAHFISSQLSSGLDFPDCTGEDMKNPISKKEYKKLMEQYGKSSLTKEDIYPMKQMPSSYEVEKEYHTVSHFIAIEEMLKELMPDIDFNKINTYLTRRFGYPNQDGYSPKTMSGTWIISTDNPDIIIVASPRPSTLVLSLSPMVKGDFTVNQAKEISKSIRKAFFQFTRPVPVRDTFFNMNGRVYPQIDDPFIAPFCEESVCGIDNALLKSDEFKKLTKTLSQLELNDDEINQLIKYAEEIKNNKTLKY